ESAVRSYCHFSLPHDLSCSVARPLGTRAMAELSDVLDQSCDLGPAEGFAPGGHAWTPVQDARAGMYSVEQRVIGPARHVTGVGVRGGPDGKIARIEAIAVAGWAVTKGAMTRVSIGRRGRRIC